MKNTKTQWIYRGVCLKGYGNGAGGSDRRVAMELPKGLRLKWAVREDNGIRVVKTVDDRYFTLVRGYKYATR